MKLASLALDGDREGSRFAFHQKFPRMSMEKLKPAISDGIRELMKDPMFDETLGEAELSA